VISWKSPLLRPNRKSPPARSALWRLDPPTLLHYYSLQLPQLSITVAGIPVILDPTR
jgi:hypothetical protein